MVDIIKSLGVPYVCGNPGSSFRGLQESIVNYGNNTQPEFLTCLHEESAVAMAHGYAKIEGKPLVVLAHGTVGLQHASMAIYNAWCDRVPVYIILGNTLDAVMRYPGVEWVHSVQDAAAMVRDYVKWDDTPISLQHFAESAIRAYKVSMTPLAGPVVVVADAELQERPIPAEHAALRIPKLTLASPPQADSGAVAELARLLVNAENPVLVADRAARSQAGMERLVELAELVQASVVSTLPNTMPPIGAGRMNFPSRHPLNHTLRSGAAIADGDLVVGLEISNFFGATNTYRDQIERSSKAATKTGAKLVTITAVEIELEGELPGLPALRGSRSRAGGGCGGNAARPDRGGEATDDRRPQTRDRRSRKETRRPEPDGPRPRAGGCDLCVGRGPDQHRSPGIGSLGAGSERGLVARERRALGLGAAPVEFREVLPVHRRIRRIGHRLRRAGCGGRRTRQPRSTAVSRSACRTTAT